MVRRVPLADPDAVIQAIEEDGGVILTGFSSAEDVQRVNADAEPYINSIISDVNQHLTPSLPSSIRNPHHH